MKTQHDRCHYSAGNENKMNIASVTDHLHLKNPHQLFVDLHTVTNHCARTCNKSWGKQLVPVAILKVGYLGKYCLEFDFIDMTKQKEYFCTFISA